MIIDHVHILWMVMSVTENVSIPNFKHERVYSKHWAVPPTKEYI